MNKKLLLTLIVSMSVLGITILTITTLPPPADGGVILDGDVIIETPNMFLSGRNTLYLENITINGNHTMKYPLNLTDDDGNYMYEWHLTDGWVELNHTKFLVDTQETYPEHLIVAMYNLGRPMYANIGERVLSFFLYMDTGDVWMNLTGFKAHDIYNVNHYNYDRNNDLIDETFLYTTTVDNMGILHFHNNEWNVGDANIFGFVKAQDGYRCILYPHQGWNMISLPYDETIDTNDIDIYWNGTTYTWVEARLNQVIGFMYWYNGNEYEIMNDFEAGKGYWFYAYEEFVEIRVV